MEISPSNMKHPAGRPRGAVYQNYYVTVLPIGNGLVGQIRPYNETAHMLTLLD